jgi:hypothetical protein
MSLALARRAVADAEAARAALAAASAAAAPDLLDELASEEELAGSPGDAKTWRLAALVGVTCLLAIATAIVLLRQHGSPNDDVGLQLPPNSSPRGSTPSASSPASGSSPSAATTSGGTPSSTTPKPTASQAAHRSTSTKPTPTTAATHRGAPGTNPSVHAAKGALDQDCGPHCYQLVVTLSAIPAGTHSVACWSSHGGMFASYQTSAVTSSDCSLQKPNASVWAVVDGKYRSNTVAW